MSQVNWLQVGSGNTPVETLTADDGSVVAPDGAENIDVFGAPGANLAINIKTDGANSGLPLHELGIRLTDSILLPPTNASGTHGVYALGVTDYVTDRFLYNQNNSVILGLRAGNFTNTNSGDNVFIGDLTAGQIQNNVLRNVVIGYTGLAQPANNFANNTGVGHAVFNNNRQGQFNSAFGYNAMSVQTNPGTYNTAIGEQTLIQVTGNYNTACGAEAASAAFGSNNTCIGAFTASNISAGADNNTCLGAFAGSNLGLNDSNNLIIAHAAVAGDNGKIRIGTTGTQTECYIGAITGVTVANAQMVVINSVTEQLGVQNIPSGVNAWSTIVVSQTAVVNNGYFCNSAGTLQLALPAASSVGDIIEVVNINNATGTQITQAAGQQIFIGNTSTTLGAAGTLTSIAVGDTLRLVCRTADTEWQVISGVASWTPA